MVTGPIVVGFDGTEDAVAAAVWAVDEAASHGAPVRLLYACQPGMACPCAPWPAAAARAQAESVVDAGVSAARAARPGVTVTGAVLAGPPHVILTMQSHHASLVVVGSRGPDRFTGPVLGSVGLALAAHAHCPVTVVREPEHPSAGAGHVLVGLDGSAMSLRALAFGFDYADRRGLAVHTIQAWSAPRHHDRDAVPDRAHGHLAATVAAWKDKFPRVSTTWEMARGPAAEVLVEASRRAQLAVVGPRGAGEYSRLPLGTVGQHLLRHGHCPVVVVREPGDCN
ncbi:universal stress protein [Phytohabitans houttuyneae]|uniref:Universal stress protein n=1 Tax=Phytohabitans houttuyneae TaxID=1076126 RepID=A0A6V8KD47_9ACTN|nr:universal stress protein [Phytohabitans houttuyneae]GFJ81704.1 universal stress protein [Phytohabitans houttuyneae]